MSECSDMACQAKKVSWKSLGVIVLALMSIFTTVTLCVMAAEKKQNEKISEIPVIQKDIEHIKDGMKNMQEDVKDIRDQLKQQITRDDLNRLIKEVQNGK